jgi:hypothetical protein
MASTLVVLVRWLVSVVPMSIISGGWGISKITTLIQTAPLPLVRVERSYRAAGTPCGASPWLVGSITSPSGLPQALCFTNQTCSSSNVRKIAYVISSLPSAWAGTPRRLELPLPLASEQTRSARTRRQTSCSRPAIRLSRGARRGPDEYWSVLANLA